VAWKGKWHLTPPIRSPINPKNEDPSILLWYGATNLWNPPDAGHSLSRSSTLGGGWKHNADGRFLRGMDDRFSVVSKRQDWILEKEGKALRGADDTSSDGEVDPRILPCSSSSDDSSTDSSFMMDDEKESILDFLAKHAKQSAATTDDDLKRPFFLVTSLVNPHDVWASACFANLTNEEFYKETGYHPHEFETLPIDLPPNYKDDLSTKPSIQSILNTSSVFGDLPTENPTNDSSESRQSDALRYVRFYAHLHKQVDCEISSLLEALDANQQLDNTIIIRMADHGEMALSHGLREKRMNCYEETMGIPLVINYPAGYFNEPLDATASTADSSTPASSTRSVSNLVSSIDILPTIAEMAGVDLSQFQYRGKSLVPFLKDNSKCDDGEEDEFLFTFDEPLAPPGVPGFVRCIRTSTFKYAVYFTEDGSCFEYEMYDLVNDPHEMTNLIPPGYEPDERWRESHNKLTSLMYRLSAMPQFFDWYVLSVPKMWSHKTLNCEIR
jgi:arylsulfatase A-like enzyme